MNDSESLSQDQLGSGMATVTRADEHFDSHPAIETAFKLSKMMINKREGIVVTEGEKSGGKKVEAVKFEEFPVFLSMLRKYYILCQVYSQI